MEYDWCDNTEPEGCRYCSGEYHIEIFVEMHHTSSNITTKQVEFNYCPYCGRALRTKDDMIRELHEPHNMP